MGCGLRFLLGDLTMKKLFALMIVCAALVVTGCGGAEEPASTPPPATPPATDQPADDKPAEPANP
jgi:hypothetical protein